MRTVLFFILVLRVAPPGLLAQDSLHIDVKGLFPNVGAMVVWVAPNNVGVPPGILAACSGTLVHDRVFLTAGHCTRASEDGVPPFIRLFVTFNLHVLDD